MSGNSVVNNIFQAMGIRNKGIGGLASGLDTDSLMEAMTITTRSKIAQEQQKKQLLNWRMTAYRSTAGIIRSFQEKYFDTLGQANSMRDSRFYNTWKATSSSDKVSVAATSNSAPVNFTIDKVHQLATSQKLTSGQALSPQLVGDNVQLLDGDGKAIDFSGKTLSLTVDGATKTLQLDKLNELAGLMETDPAYDPSVAVNQGTIDAKLQSILTEIMDENFAPTGNRLVTLPDSTQAAFNTLDETDYTAAEWEDIMKQARTINVSVSGNKISLTSDYTKFTVGSAASFDVAGHGADERASVNDLLGLTAGQSNRVSTSGTLLRDINGIGGALAGDSYKFKINGVEFTARADESLQGLIDRVNSSTANVRMEYNTKTDSITLTSKITGYGQNLQVEDTYGNLMNKLFGSGGSDDISSRQLTANNGQILGLADYESMSTEQKLAFARNFNTRSFNMTINGITKAVGFRISSVKDLSQSVASGVPPTLDEIAQVLNSGLDSAFGSYGNAIRGGVYFTTLGDKLMVNSSDPNTAVTMENNKASTGRDFLGALGFDEGNRTNVADLSDPAALSGISANSVGIADGTYTINVTDPLAGTTNAISIVVDGSTTLQNLIDDLDAYGVKLSVKNILESPDAAPNAPKDFRLVLETNGNQVEDVGANGLLGQLFGVSSYQAAPESADFTTNMQMGKNAEIEVDGQVLSFENNTFTLNGASITLNDVSDEAIRIGVEANPDELIDKIKTFIDDYNVMIESLNTMIYEEAEDGYTPLSDEQKADMSADEIEKWENEAKKGILRSDSTLRGIIDELRGAFYQKIDSVGLAGYDIGITTKSVLNGDMKDNGKIELTERGEEKLRLAVEQNPDAVREVFTNADDGIANKLWDIMDNAVNESSLPEVRGSLVRIAGTANTTADNSSNLGDQIDSVDQKLTTLRARLESEYNRYWKQFSSLEVAISKLNSQASMFQ